MTLVDPDVHDTPVPDVEVLIKEARRRSRRRRARVAAALLAVAGIGLAAGFGFDGGGFSGGGGAGSRGDAGGAAGGVGSGSSDGPTRIVSSRSFKLAGYELGARRGQIELNVDQGQTDSCRLLSPRTLRVDATERNCGDPNLPRDLSVSFSGGGDVIRVRSRPVVTIDNWSWAHSGAVSGDGSVWIFDLATSRLFEVSARTGKLLHRFRVPAEGDPFMAVDADGFWITQSAWGGQACPGRCTLWHVAPGSGRVVAVRSLGVRTQWLTAAGHSIYLDVLTPRSDHGFAQSIWRLDGAGARTAYRTPATLLPSTDFASETGYFVVGNPSRGYFTLTQLGRGRTPNGVGNCDLAAPIRLVRIDSATGAQSYVATLTRHDAGAGLDCHLGSHQAVLDHGAFYVLTGQKEGFPAYTRVVRLPTR